MRSLKLALAAATLAVFPSGLKAADYTFTSGGFTGTYSLDSAGTTLTALNFDPYGYDFNLTNSSFDSSSSIIGANANGVGTVYLSQNDFFLSGVNSGSGELAIGSTTGSYYIGNAAITETAASAAPEPATWAMMILGLGLVGGVMYRRRRNDVTTRIGFAA